MRALKAFLALLITALLPQLVFAGTGIPAPGTNPLDFTPPATDLSVKLLGSIFGIVDGVLAGTGSQILGSMLGVFNAAVLAVGGILLTYALLISTLNTAQEGEFLGKKWSSVWVPVRVVTGVALLIPKASGYCLMQIFVMWVVVQGIGAADRVWGSALSYMARGGVLMDVGRAQTPIRADQTDKVEIAAKILTTQVCMAGLQNTLDKVRKDKLGPPSSYGPNNPDPGAVPDFIGSVNFVNQKDREYLTQTITFPNFPAGHNYAKFNGVCGEIDWHDTITDKLELIQKNMGITGPMLDQLLDQIKQSRVVALNGMYLDLAPVARAIASNYMDNPTPFPLGTLSADEKLWVGEGGKPPLLTGLEIKNAATTYITFMAPTLRIMQANLSNRTKFVPEAYKEGWIMAGSYFFELIRLNMQAATIVNDSGVITVKEANARTAGERVCGLEGGQQPFCADIAALKKGYPALHEKLMKGLLQNAQVSSYYGAAQRIKTEGIPGAGTGFKGPDKNAFNFQLVSAARIPYMEYGDIPWYEKIPLLVPYTLVNLVVSLLNLFLLTAITFINALLFAIQGFMWMLAMAVDLFLKLLRSVLTSGYNPIVALGILGNIYINLGISLWIAYAALALVGGTAAAAMPGIIGGIIAFFLMFSPLFFLLLGIILTTGILFAYYVPLVPYILFTFGAMAWFVAVIEAMVAAPILALGILHPEAQNEALGRAEPGIMILLNVFLRPSMMVIGFIAGILLSYVMVWLLCTGFDRAVSGIMGGEQYDPTAFMGLVGGTHNYFRDAVWPKGMEQFGLSGSVLGGGGTATGFSMIVGPFFMMAVFDFMYITLVQRSFDLIHIIPDKVLRFIQGGAAESLGEGIAGRAAGEVMQRAERRGEAYGQSSSGASLPRKEPDKGKEDQGVKQTDGQGGDSTSMQPPADSGSGSGSGGGGPSGGGGGPPGGGLQVAPDAAASSSSAAAAPGSAAGGGAAASGAAGGTAGAAAGGAAAGGGGGGAAAAAALL